MLVVSFTVTRKFRMAQGFVKAYGVVALFKIISVLGANLIQ